MTKRCNSKPVSCVRDPERVRVRLARRWRGYKVCCTPVGLLQPHNVVTESTTRGARYPAVASDYAFGNWIIHGRKPRGRHPHHALNRHCVLSSSTHIIFSFVTPVFLGILPCKGAGIYLTSRPMRLEFNTRPGGMF